MRMERGRANGRNGEVYPSAGHSGSGNGSQRYKRWKYRHMKVYYMSIQPRVIEFLKFAVFDVIYTVVHTNS